jgi:hypothetical protein
MLAGCVLTTCSTWREQALFDKITSAYGDPSPANLEALQLFVKRGPTKP